MSSPGSSSLQDMSSTDQPVPEVVEVEAATTAVISGVVPMSEIAPFFDRAFSTLPGVLAQQGVAPLGAAFALYHSPPGETLDLSVGFPTDRPVEPAGEVHASRLPAGRVARVVHHGSFDQLGSSWERLRAWIDEQGLTAGGVLWEVYVTEPNPQMDPAELRTELNWLLA
jgi:effector-binding domain-containing protein